MSFRLLSSLQSANSLFIYRLFCTPVFYFCNRISGRESRIAAFDLLVTLCEVCPENLQQISCQLINMHHQPDLTILKEWDVSSATLLSCYQTLVYYPDEKSNVPPKNDVHTSEDILTKMINKFWVVEYESENKISWPICQYLLKQEVNSRVLTVFYCRLMFIVSAPSGWPVTEQVRRFEEWRCYLLHEFRYTAIVYDTRN